MKLRFTIGLAMDAHSVRIKLSIIPRFKNASNVQPTAVNASIIRLQVKHFVLIV